MLQLRGGENAAQSANPDEGDEDDAGMDDAQVCMPGWK